MTAGEVMTRMRFHLNDVGIAYFTDAILLEPLNVALDDLRGELLDNNIPITNGTSAILAIAAGVNTAVTFSSIPPLPAALVEIQEVMERDAGSLSQFISMQKVEFLPRGVQPSNELIYWTWAQQGIFFIGSTSNREVLINYLADITAPAVGPASLINVLQSMPFLAYRGAALAAENLGEDTERANSLNANAARELDKLMNLSVKGKQAIPVRRRPFQANYRRQVIS